MRPPVDRSASVNGERRDGSLVSCDRGGVRIGIEAPAEVKILRGEIAEKIALENQRATAASASPWLASLVPATAAAAPVPPDVVPPATTS